MGNKSDVKWYRKTKTKVVVELPEEIINYVESHSSIGGITPEKYIQNLVTIDILVNRVTELKESMSDWRARL